MVLRVVQGCLMAVGLVFVRLTGGRVGPLLCSIVCGCSVGWLLVVLDFRALGLLEFCGL